MLGSRLSLLVGLLVAAVAVPLAVAEDDAGVTTAGEGEVKRVKVSASSHAKLIQGLRKHPDANCFSLHGKIPDQSIGRLYRHKNVLSLYVRSDFLTEQSYVAISRMKHLRELCVKDNHLDNDKTRHLGRLTDLEMLEIGGARRVTDEGMVWLGRLQKLHTLELSFGQYIPFDGRTHRPKQYHTKTPGDETFKQLSKLVGLRKLVLGSNSDVDGEGMRAISTLTELRHLELDSVELRDEHFAQLDGLVHLEHIDIGGKHLTAKSLVHLLSIEGLQLKHLRFPSVLTDEEVAMLAEHKRLTSLSIGGPGITDRSIGVLAGFGALEYLSVGSSGLTEAGRERLESALPNAKVYVRIDRPPQFRR